VQTERGLGLVFFYEKEEGVRFPTGYILKEKINRVCTSKTQETKETKKNKNKTQSMQKRVLHSSSCCLCSTKKKKGLLVFVLYSMLKHVEFFLEI